MKFEAGKGTAFKKPSTREEKKSAILRAAEKTFAEFGFKGATTQMIADLAKIPKANLHYYFPTKEALYSQVVQNIFDIWLDAADSFDHKMDPAEALASYIDKKMEISRLHPNGSKVWANEVMHGAPIIQDYLETTLKEWTHSREAVIQNWIDEGRMDRVNPKHLLYMIWATTQHYADFVHQVETLNAGRALDDDAWRAATDDVKKIILNGVGLKIRGDI